MIFIKTFLLSLLYFVIVSILPHLKTKGAKSTLQSYLYNVIGYIVLTVTLYSTILTKGNSVFILIFPVFCILYFKLKNKLEFSFLIKQFELKHISILIIFYFLIYILQFCLLYENDYEYIKIPHSDCLFYSKVATNLNMYHIESYHLSPLSQNIPYHYFELWLNAFFNLFGLKSYISLLLIVYPIILTLVCFTTYILVNKGPEFSLKFILISLSIIFIQATTIPIIYNNIPFFNGDAALFTINVMNTQKTSIIMLFFLISILVYKKHGINYFLLCISTCIALYSPLILGIIGILIGAAISKVFNKESKISYSILIYFFFLVIIFQLFYKFNGYKSNFDIEINLVFIKTMINIIGGTIIRIVAFLIIFILFSLIIRKKIIAQIKDNLEVVFIIVIGCISSLLGWAITHRTFDSVQLFSNFSSPLIIIVVFFLIVNNLKPLFQAILIILIISINIDRLNISNNIHYITSLKSVINFNKYSNGVFMKDTIEYYNLKLNINPDCSIYLGDACMINDQIKIQDLTLGDLKNKQQICRSMINRYLKSNEYHNALINNVIQNKSQYIKKNKIDFLIHKSNLKIDSSIIKLFNNKKYYKEFTIYY